MTQFEALAKALEKAGSQSALAAICGCSQQAVSKMLQAKRMSHLYVLKAEQGTGVSRHDLRPDIYPRPARTKKTRCASDEGLTPWDTGNYGNNTEFSDNSPIERFA